VACRWVVEIEHVDSGTRSASYDGTDEVSNERWIRCLCKVGFHRWQYTRAGQLYKGSVYPLNIRTCRRCAKSQQQIFNHNDGSHWSDYEPNAGQSSDGLKDV